MSKSYPDTGFGWQGTDAKIVLPRLSDETCLLYTSPSPRD